ncbi:MAG: hypothetical protein ACMV1K_09465 [Sulfurospirillum sp.]|jgi:hypothetical protein
MPILLQYAEKANFLLPVLILILIVMYAKPMLNLLDQWKMRKINYLTSLYENKNLDEDTKKMVKSEINNAAFKSAIGINVETLMREQLVSLHNIDKNTFTWRRLRMALSYIELEGTDIVVKIGWLEKFSYYLTILGIAFSFLMYSTNWIIFAFNRNLESFINAIIFTFGSGLVFLFFVYQFAQYYHAVKLKNSLEELNKKSQS